MFHESQSCRKAIAPIRQGVDCERDAGGLPSELTRRIRSGGMDFFFIYRSS
jgi:hypothetical protein